MSFVGKVLIVVQVVMSICFMAFAGAVYVTQENWRQKHDSVSENLERQQKTLQDTEAQLQLARDEVERVTRETQQEINKWKLQAETASTQLAAKIDELNRANTLAEQYLANADSKETEAENRVQESKVLRKQNADLQAKINDVQNALNTAKDELFNSQTALARLRERYDELLVKSSYLEKVVRKYNFNTDPATVAAMSDPAPPLDGLVKEVREDATNRTKYVLLSVGSDDGLRVGHVMDVFRPATEDADTLYLGKIRIIDVDADASVGEVTQRARNGNIEVGDNVTTNLF